MGGVDLRAVCQAPDAGGHVGTAIDVPPGDDGLPAVGTDGLLHAAEEIHQHGAVKFQKALRHQRHKLPGLLGRDGFRVVHVKGRVLLHHFHGGRAEGFPGEAAHKRLVHGLKADDISAAIQGLRDFLPHSGIVVQQAHAVRSRFVCPEIVRRPDDSVALQVGLVPELTVLRVGQAFVQACPVRRAVDELLGKQVLVHVKQNVDAIFLRQVHNILHFPEILHIHLPRLRLRAVPEDAEAQQVEAGTPEVAESFLKFRIEVVVLPLPLQNIQAVEDDLLTALVYKTCTF